jgi:hypothetical protein
VHPGRRGGEIQLWRRLEVAHQLGFRLMVVIASAWRDGADARRVRRYLERNGVECEFVHYDAFYVTPDTKDILPKPAEIDSLREFFGRRSHEISLVHSLAFLPAVGMVCSEFAVPHMASIYGVADDYEFPFGPLPFKYCDLVQSDSIRYARKWSQLLGRPWACVRETVPAPSSRSASSDCTSRRSRTGRGSCWPWWGRYGRKCSRRRARDGPPEDIRSRVELHMYGASTSTPNTASPAGAPATGRGRRGPRRLPRPRERSSRLPERRRRAERVVLRASPARSRRHRRRLPRHREPGRGIAKMMVDEVNCLMVDSLDPDHLAETIVRAVRSDPSARQAMRRNAFAPPATIHPRHPPLTWRSATASA